MNEKTIFQLDMNTINQIAAGEVIDSPYSIVKELVENSIDAKSKHIIIRINDGGKKSIEILDDGYGMSQEDMKICYLKHTTSKIKNVHDITYVSTMGFRGEALSSISSVAKVQIQSKRLIDNFGYQITLENSQIINEGVCAFNNQGTRIIVNDLFYNIPVRKSFLDNEKSSKESRLIVDLLQRLSLSNAHIRFELFIDDECIYKTFGDGKIEHVLMEVYDTSLVKKLLYLETEVYGVKVKGYISKPENCIGNRTKQTFFVNNRFVKMDILSTALKTAYNEYAVSSKYPICLLFIEAENEQIDVNIHPRKTEVKFKFNIFPVILSAIKACLYQNVSSPQITNSLQSNQNINYDNNSMHHKTAIDSTINSYKFILNNNQPFQTTNNESSPLFNEQSYNNENINEDIHKEYEQLSFIDTVVDYRNGFKEYSNLKVSSQIHNSYIIAEYENGMIMIDQHAAHERVLYEKFLKQMDNNSFQSLDTLIPETIELNSSTYYSLKQNIQFFEDFGFRIEDFGGTTIIIRQYPSILEGHNIKNMIMTLIDEIYQLDGKSTLDEMLRKKIIMKSCKKAIKANMPLSMIEMEGLMNSLVKCENPYHCPHGRPIIINFTTYDIEKFFNRVV